MSLPPRPAPVGARPPRVAPRRVSSAAARRYALALALTGLAIAAGAAARLASAEADQAEARALLLRGDTDAAARLYARLSPWPWSRPAGAAGGALCAALRAETAGSAPAPSPSAGDLETLANGALARGDLAAARALSDLAAGWAHPLAPLWRAALAFESGDLGPATRLADTRPWLMAGRGLGQRLAAELAARAAGARTPVRDRNGERLGALDGAGRFLPDARVDPAWLPGALVTALEARGTRAPGVRASLDLDLSRLAQAALGSARGSIVLVDPRRGDVLAAVSDARSSRRGGTPAFEERREPASIAKLITTAAALRAGLDPDAAIARLTCTGSGRYGNGTLWCAYRAGPLSGLDEALAVSCNIAFAELGVAVGREALVAELRRWGFDRPAPELMGAAGRVLQPLGDERQLADLAVGLEATDVTPLHGALLATVLSNEGRMPEPRLLVGDEGPLGLDRRPDPAPPARPVIDPAWVPTLRRAMEAVALYGTAAGVMPAGYPVAMKTGTAAAWRAGYHVNYVGIAPSPAADVAFCVRVTHQPSSARANRTAREVLRALLRGLAARHGQPYLASRLTLPNPTPEPLPPGRKASSGSGLESAHRLQSNPAMRFDR